MGLGGGPNGAKAVFRERFASAFRDFSSLAQARECVGTARAQTLVVVDGNVLVMQVPASVDTFSGYVAVLTNALHNAIAAGEHVVVVFDEPEHLTRAKQEEQARRDARRYPQTPLCSDDVAPPCPRNDDYDAEQLMAEHTNIKLLMNHRLARPRFYDALCTAVLDRLTNAFSEQACAWSLTFDGVDPRGADRPFDKRRVPGVLSTLPDVWVPLLRRADPIGEGDLKLADVCHRVYRARTRFPDARVAQVRLNMLSTVDTDSFMIELIAQSRREERADTSQNELTLLCLREPGRKRGREASAAASYTCIDIEEFHDGVMAYLFGSRSLRPEIEARKPLAALLLAASIALCGCDFVEVRGMRADRVLPIVREIARHRPELLARMAGVQTGDARLTAGATDAIRAVVEDYVVSIMGERACVAVAHASACSDLQLLRAV